MNQIQVKLKKPHKKQLELLNCRAKRIIVRAGRRSGKTTAAAILAVRAFLAGRRVLYGAPVLEQCSSFWREVTVALAPLVAEKLLIKNETESYIEKPATSARIKCKTCWSPETLRGDFADVLILDEWQLMDPRAWDECAAPMLLDNNGDCLFIYTPPSRSNRSTARGDPRHAAKLFARAQADTSGRWAAFHFSSSANPHISRAALADITKDMTALAFKQEIEALDIDETPGALWRQSVIDDLRVDYHPELTRVIVAVDPSGSSKATADEAGIIVAGLAKTGHAYVICDLSKRATPREWAQTAIAAFHSYRADRIIAEQNFGAEMVELTLRTVDPNIPFKAVVASRGKQARAEPVSSLYEKKLVHHVGVLESLEGEMCSWVPGNPSPGRMDALVWALTELMLGGQCYGLLELFRRWCSDPAGEAEREREALFKLNQEQHAALVRMQETERRLRNPPPPDAPPGVICPQCGTVGAASYRSGNFVFHRCGSCGNNWPPPPSPRAWPPEYKTILDSPERVLMMRPRDLSAPWWRGRR